MMTEVQPPAPAERPPWVLVSAGFPASLGAIRVPDPEDWSDLAERLRCRRADPAIWRDCFQPLATTLRSFNWSAMAAALVGLVENLPAAAARPMPGLVNRKIAAAVLEHP